MNWNIDPPDDDAYDVRYDGTDCADCGRPAVAWLCETCSDQRDSHTSALQLRMAGVVEVALLPLLPISRGPAGVVEVALVPVDEVRQLKRMAKAILSADLTNIREVA
jgi:hypothetical protein